MEPEETGARPPTLKVLRWRDGETSLQVIVGDRRLPLPEDELVKLARDAMAQRTFVAHATAGQDGSAADELCFVPHVSGCEILSIHADAWRRHHGDHRRSLMEILNDLAAAVACGRLRFLDDRQLAAELQQGAKVYQAVVTDSASLATARTEVGAALDAAGFPGERREETILCVSEAVTNALVHGGGKGTLELLDVDGHARLVVADTGPGLSFLNWLDSPGPSGQPSMGYGFHIILDHIDDVCLSTGPTGTTLILDQHPRRPEVTDSC